MKNILHLYFAHNQRFNTFTVTTNAKELVNLKIPTLLFPFVDLKGFLEEVKTSIESNILNKVPREYNSVLGYYNTNDDYFAQWCANHQLNPNYPITVKISCFNEKGEYVPYTYTPRTEKYDIAIENSAVTLNIEDIVYTITVNEDTSLNSVVGSLNEIIQSVNPTLKLSFKDMLVLNTFKAYSQLVANELFVRHNDLYFKDFKTSLNYKMKSLLEDRKKSDNKQAIEDDIKSLSTLNKLYDSYQKHYLRPTT